MLNIFRRKKPQDAAQDAPKTTHYSAEEMAAAHGDDPAGQMLVYGGLGDADRAFAALERSVDLHW